MDDEDVQELMARVERIAQCPVCLEVVRSPVVQCVNGHVTCGQCRNNARNCHVCRQPYSDTSPRVLEEVLSVLPQRCPNEQCSVVALLDHHVQYCIFRQIKCKVNECGWSGTVQACLDHINDNHANAEFGFDAPKCLYFYNFLEDFTSVRYYYHRVGDQIFLTKLWKQGNKLYQTYRNIKCEKSNNEYGILVSYKSGSHDLYKTLIEVLPYEDDENSIDTGAAVFSLEELNGLVDRNDNLSVFVQAVDLSV